MRGNTGGQAIFLTIVSGNDQSAVRGKPVPAPLAVRAVDNTGTPVAGATVNWSGSGTFNPPSSLTDAEGVARTTWTLAGNTTAGSQSAFARLPATGNIVTFNAQALEPAVASLELTGPAQLPCCGGSYDFLATARDDLGNVIPDALLTWRVSVDTVIAVYGGFRSRVAPARPLFPGNATITVSSGAHSASVPVTVLPAAAGPVLQVYNEANASSTSGQTLTFNRLQAGGTHPSHYNLHVRNSGGSGTVEGISVAVQYTQGDAGWLTTSLPSTTAPTLLQVAVNPAVPVTRNSTATVTVSSTTPGTTPVTYNVLLVP